jgi:hypothetical protein
MFDKKQKEIKSPDLNSMKRVVIDQRTTLYIGKDDDPEKAKQRYHDRGKKPE